MKQDKIYCSYAEYSVIYDTKKEMLDLGYNNRAFLKNLRVESKNKFSSYKVKNYVEKTVLDIKNHGMKIVLSDKGISIKTAGDSITSVKGDFSFGKNPVPINTKAPKNYLRTALGKNAAKDDNGIFDISKDSAVCFEGNEAYITYDKDSDKYGFEMTSSEVSFRYIKNVYADKYNITYAPVNKNSTFRTPPMGWMTWYAVKFNACEEVILENAKWQSENLKKYGANTIWVDWEWYHDTLTGIRDDGVNAFCCDRKRFPNGMKHVADEIKKLGLIPSLWIGFTNDPSMPEYVKENPGIVISDDVMWCGRYFYDFTHPKYLNEYLPMAMKQVKEWGYEAIKYDTLPAAVDMQDKYRLKAYNPKITTKDAYRNMIKKVRELAGRDTYMLSCAALRDADVLWAADMFDGARIGNDIFKWSEFIKEGAAKAVRYYPLHNKVLYCDPDNVVLREEFNTFHQAETRIYLISMLGLPMTFGDVFKELPEERVELIKKCLPVMDIRSCDLNRYSFDGEYLPVKLEISTAYDDYIVMGMFNLKEAKAKRTLELLEIVGDTKIKYHVYDFTHNKYLGIFEGKEKLEFDFDEHECRILSVREVKDVPQVVSTTRHFSQGAEEITDVKFKDDVLTIRCKPIEGEKFDVIIYIPPEYTKTEGMEKIGENLYQFSCEKEVYEFKVK